MAVRLEPGTTTMYAQLGMILRSKIMRGEWAPKSDIPTLEELCEQYDVARITARQAVQMLVQEGLLSSRRGRRTWVSYEPPETGENPLFTSIGSAWSDRPNFSISILEVREVESLPEQPFTGVPNKSYVLIRKVDQESGEPYAYSENYVRKDIFQRFPPGAIETSKLARLLDTYAKKLATGRERLRVLSADFEEASQLRCPIAAPAARVERIFCDSDDHILYYGTLTYRGDRFAVEHDITSHLNSSKNG